MTLLAATVRYTDTLLSAPTIWEGGILPQPLADPVYFVPSEDAGKADATFFTFSPDSVHHILSDGVFFSFDVVVTAPGRGQLWFEFADALQFNPDPLGEPISATPTMGSPLDFRAVDVPEPAAWLMLLSAAAAVLFALRARPSCLFPRSAGLK